MAAHSEGHDLYWQPDPLCCFYMDILYLHPSLEKFKSFFEVCEDTIIYETGLT